MADDDTHILDQLPARLKKLRQGRGLSLEAVSKLSGVSRSMLSQIERGESSPTVATLWNLTRALQVDFAGLLDEDASGREIDILRADDTPSLNPRGAGCVINILSPPDDVGRHEIYDLHFAAGGCLDSAPHSPGTREHITVLTGAVTLTCDAEEAEIGEGDSARYPADVPHRIEAGSAAHVFMIVMRDGV
ncbi:helix-turn-helix domain-containing protein [Tropicimonas sp. TH_r6]|uniref:helix-turn-helix domain-containing protein n=1 Tax=Tropicimonas sp. TH_r6 TaxID=3082085 RepID=UPI003986E21B